MNERLIYAPFTPEQVESLNEYQNSLAFHPFTCGGKECRNDLVATSDGWHCPDPACDYAQNWAHEWMGNNAWKEFDAFKLQKKFNKKRLFNLMAEAVDELPDLLKDKTAWKSLYIDYHPPIVKRLWAPWRDGRIFLHEIDPCLTEEALYHPHPWPSGIMIADGVYEMGVGYGPFAGDPPPMIGPMILGPWSTYVMDTPNEWHYVRPLTVVRSFMVTDKSFPGINAKEKKPSKPQRPLTDYEASTLFGFFDDSLFKHNDMLQQMKICAQLSKQ